MSTKGKPQRGEKKYYGKDHVHKPKKGKGGYRRKGRRNFKQKQIDEIIEDELND